MPLKLIRNVNGSGLSPRGLLRWSDLRRFSRWLVARSRITGAGLLPTETGNGLSIVAKPGIEQQLYPLMPIGETVDAVEVTRIKPGLLFAGTSWAIPVIGSTSIFDDPAPTLTGWPKRVYLKTTWKPNIVPFYWVATLAGTRRPLDVFPGDVEIVSCEVVGTDAASPEAAGWTAAGDSNQVPARVRRTQSPLYFGSYTAVVASNGVHYERIGLHRDDYPGAPSGGWPMVYPPLGSGTAAGHRSLDSPTVLRTESVSSGVVDYYIRCVGRGILSSHFVV